MIVAAIAQVFFYNLHQQWILNKRAIYRDFALMMEVVILDLKIKNRKKRSLSVDAK